MTTEKTGGYGNPPKHTRFKPGQSGNPNGRPKNRHRTIPYDAVLGQIVTVREDGQDKRMTAAEAFLIHLLHSGLSGNSAAAMHSLDSTEQARATKERSTFKLEEIAVKFIATGIDSILDTLGMAVLKYSNDEARARWELEPWIVEAALERLGDDTLSLTEQSIVWQATRTPHRVKWPKWWTIKV